MKITPDRNDNMGQVRIIHWHQWIHTAWLASGKAVKLWGIPFTEYSLGLLRKRFFCFLRVFLHVMEDKNGSGQRFRLTDWRTCFSLSMDSPSASRSAMTYQSRFSSVRSRFIRNSPWIWHDVLLNTPCDQTVYIPKCNLTYLCLFSWCPDEQGMT